MFARMSTQDRLNFWTRKSFPTLTTGDRHEVDLLAKLRFKRQEAFLLVHVENQAQSYPDFGMRMHGYFARLHEKHNLPVRRLSNFQEGWF